MGNTQHQGARRTNSNRANGNTNDIPRLVVRERSAAKDNLDADHELVERLFHPILRRSMESVGVVTFLKMFETHPETLRPFIADFHSMPEIELDEWYRENLKVHAIRVMSVIEKVMHRLDDEKRAALVLMVYGRRHCGYGVTASMLELMASAFVLAIEPQLEDVWSKEMEQSWRELFFFITFFMKSVYPHNNEEAEAEAEAEAREAEEAEGGGSDAKRRRH